MSKKTVLKKLTALILVPLAFTVFGYVILLFSAKSTVQPITDMWNLLATDVPLGESDGMYTDLYSGELFREYTDTIPSSIITFPSSGSKYGEISIDGTSVNCPLFFGDDSKTLRRGAGQYLGSSFPGMGSTCIIGGHNNSFFGGLKDCTVGSLITVKTHYGIYTYKITETAIKTHNDATAYDLSADYENLVLYTCYPFNALGLTSKRFFVYGEYVSGPRILLDK